MLSVKIFVSLVHREKMFEFEIKSPVGKVAKKLLQRYQARDLHRESNVTSVLVLNETGKKFEPYLACEAVGKKIECMDGDFEVHEWCLHNSDFFLDFLEGPF